jgi:hypothetical protein
MEIIKNVQMRFYKTQHSQGCLLLGIHQELTAIFAMQLILRYVLEVSNIQMIALQDVSEMYINK